MATVRFSDNLRHNIRVNARALFESRIITAQNSFDKTLLNGFYDKLFGPYLTQMNALPSEFFKSASRLDVRVASGAKIISVDLGRERPVPARNISVPNRFSMHAHYSAPDVYLDSSSPEWEYLRVEYTAWKQRILEADEKYKEFASMVDKIIDAHVTLAPALKVWPALWELLPEETKERHKQVKDSRRKKVKEELQGVDLGKLTAAVTVSKLRGR